MNRDSMSDEIFNFTYTLDDYSTLTDKVVDIISSYYSNGYPKSVESMKAKLKSLFKILTIYTINCATSGTNFAIVLDPRSIPQPEESIKKTQILACYQLIEIRRCFLKELLGFLQPCVADPTKELAILKKEIIKLSKIINTLGELCQTK